ncbi:MAG: hypothetical protein FWE05_09810 [Defluviitaleaceae bacterium]|nr:hypothetical protein [Defluviitaleaceae bacterium]
MYNNQGNQGNRGNQGIQNNHSNPKDQDNYNNQDHYDNQDHHESQSNHDCKHDCKHDHQRKITCHTEISEDITMTIPVEVRAHARVGNVTLKCMDSHIITEHERPRNTSKFKIVQKISAKIPVDFITEVEVGDEHVDFDAHACD